MQSKILPDLLKMAGAARVGAIIWPTSLVGRQLQTKRLCNIMSACPNVNYK